MAADRASDKPRNERMDFRNGRGQAWLGGGGESGGAARLLWVVSAPAWRRKGGLGDSCQDFSQLVERLKGGRWED